MSSHYENTVRITEDDMRRFHFDCIRLREEGGFNEHQLKYAGFDCDDLRNAGFNATQLRCAGFDATALRTGGFSVEEVHNAGFNHKRLKAAGFTAADLHHHLGCDAVKLKAAGYNPFQLKVGYRVSELRAIGFPASEVMNCYTPGELLRAGYSKEELKPLGLWPHDGEWNNYNQYWGCCLSLDKASTYCAPTMVQQGITVEKQGSFLGLSGRRPSR